MPDTVFLPDRIEVTRPIAAPPSAIFDIVRSPAGHVAIDASGMLQDYTAPTDLYRLIDTVIEADDLRFEIYNAVSGNTFTRLPMHKAREDFGYEPDYDSFQLSTPFREAIRAVGVIADRAMESGLREEVGAARREELM